MGEWGELSTTRRYYGFFQLKRDGQREQIMLSEEFHNVLEITNPDIIHIWGTECSRSLSMICACESKGLIERTVISLQGFSSLIAKHYLSRLPFSVVYRYTLWDLLKQDCIKQQQLKYKKRGLFEIKALQKVYHVIGRTEWDFAYVSQINPTANYYTCNEILRDAFYTSRWDIDNCERYSMFVSQGNYPIKGLHNVLEAMVEIVKSFPQAKLYVAGGDVTKSGGGIFDYVKRTYYGVYLCKLIKKYNLTGKKFFLGSLDEQQMCNRYLRSHVYISSSSIENESNSLSEVKMLGVPCAASYVGEVTNRLEHGMDGYFYQHDAPYMLAHYIKKIFTSDDLAKMFLMNAKKSAKKINDREQNVLQIMDIYRKIANDNG